MLIICVIGLNYICYPLTYQSSTKFKAIGFNLNQPNLITY